MDEPPQDSGRSDDERAEPAASSSAGGGSAPVVVGGAKMRAQIAAALFGDAAPKPSHAQTLPADEAAAALAHEGDLEESILKERLGRFRVLSRLGRGGMGVVYSAYDPQLDRKVALKVLRPELHEGVGAEAATARLLREAQAMAKINDPHVIVVHEVGMLEVRVFIAMEYVDGGTLGAWMAKRRPWREVISIFIRAGSGLAAAHRGGLVHRDFKPENVLMGTDGRVRVVDFGLARSVLDTAADELPSPRPAQEQPETDSFSTPLTRTGAVMGTPAYMSPEQHLGRPADARSDQFSYCVALWEALFGERPFAGASLTELTTSVLDGVVRDPPVNARVPRWIVAALRRGLSRKPTERFDTMEALLDELRTDPRKKWRIGVGATAAVALAAFLGIGAYQNLLTGECDQLVDSMATTWNEDRRTEVVNAIAVAELPWGERVAESTAKALGDYAANWQRLVKDECSASLVGSKEARATWKNKRLCFQDRAAEVDQLIVLLIEGGPEMATTALQAAMALSDLSVCEDPRRLAIWEELADPVAQERLAYARKRLVRAATAGSVGRFQRAIEAATAVIEDARELNVGALEGEALVVRGLNRLRVDTHDPKAEADLRLAIERAGEVGDPALRAKALIQLGLAVSTVPTRYQEAIAIGDRAGEAIESLGEAPMLRAQLDAMLGVAARGAGELDKSIAYFRAALAAMEDLVGESHVDTVRLLNGLGISLRRNGNYDESLEVLRRAVTAYEAMLGGDHPDLATVRQSMGNCLAKLERYDEALDVLTLVRDAYAANPEATPTQLLKKDYNIAFVWGMSGNFEESLRRAQAGMPRAKRLLSKWPKGLEDWHSLLARGLARTGRYAEAVVAYQDVLAIQRGAKMDAMKIVRTQLSIAQLTAEFDRGRAGVLADQLSGELDRMDSSAGVDRAQADVKALQATLSEAPPPSGQP